MIAQYGSGQSDFIVPRQGTIETFVSCYSAASFLVSLVRVYDVRDISTIGVS